MAKRPPKLIAVDHDDYHAEHVGRTADGRQFFLTTPFVPEVGCAGREFLAPYLFDPAGQLVEARIEDLGTRPGLDEESAREKHDAMLASLGPVVRQRINVAPFAVERFGVEFGFIPHPPEEPDEDWTVTVEPGDVMCFGPPWSRGWYET